MISREMFNAYNADVEKLVSEASKKTQEQINAWCALNKNASIAECREMAKSVMDGMTQVYGDAASTLAADWYDKQANKAHIKLPSAITVPTYDKKQVKKTAHYQAEKLKDGNIAGFSDRCAELVENQVKIRLNDTIMANAKRDKKKGVRYARVPTGGETCAFCLMLASRGAVYWSRGTAGESRYYHRRCDCKIVPGFEVDQYAELVEGNKPLEINKRISQIEQVTGLKFISKNFGVINKHLSLLSKDWVYYGKVPEISYVSEEVKAFKTRTKKEKKTHKKETATVEKIRHFGFETVFVIDQALDKTGKNTIGLADLASGLEIKTLEGATSKNTIESHMENASGKKNAKAVLFDNTDSGLSDKKLSEILENSRKFKRGLVYVYKKDGTVKLIKRKWSGSHVTK